jgi:hypothetical protein
LLDLANIKSGCRACWMSAAGLGTNHRRAPSWRYRHVVAIDIAALMITVTEKTVQEVGMRNVLTVSVRRMRWWTTGNGLTPRSVGWF